MGFDLRTFIPALRRTCISNLNLWPPPHNEDNQNSAPTLHCVIRKFEISKYLVMGYDENELINC